MSDLDLEAMWPTGTMHLLLQASFHNDVDVARQAWAAWERETDFDRAGWSEMRVCAVVARRLGELGLSAENMPRIHGIRRYIWAKSSSVLNASLPVLEALHDAGIPAVVLKGGGRRILGGAHGGERHIQDVDVLIPKARFVDVLDLAAAIGWNNCWDASREWLETMFVSARHSIGISQDGKNEVDLHIHSLLVNRCPDHDDGLWARAQRTQLGKLEVLVPSPADQLIAACVHGQLHSPDGAQDWVGDVVGLLADGNLDWDVVLDELERRDVWVYAKVALDYIVRGLGHEIPGFVTDRINGSTTELFQAEYLGMASTWDAETREVRACWGAATKERARRWRSRVEKSSGNEKTSRRQDGSWMEVWERDNLESAYRAPVPIWTHETVGLVYLDIDCEMPSATGLKTFDVVIACFESHQLEIAGEVVTLKKWFKKLGRNVQVTFPIEAAMLAAHVLVEVEIQFLLPGTLDPAPVSVRSFKVRWRA